jgi:cytochrome c5
MDRRTLISFTTMLVVLLLGSLVVASCGTGQEETVAPTSGQEQVTPPTLDGQSLVQERCTRCHDLGRITQAKKTEEEWKATVERMVSKGANLDSAEQEAVIRYLAETYPR